MEHQTSSTPASQESKAHLRHILASEPTLPPASLKVAAPATEPDPTPEHVVPPSSSRKKAEREPAAQNKMRFLKKDDGTPFWRRDIQYKLLESIFNDDKKLFTKMSDQTRGHTFADVYVDAMARSSKCSKLLQEKLLSDTLDLSVIPARDMAMVCLLVNVGRMNTTVNCTPITKDASTYTLTQISLPRDASSSTNLPLNTLPTSSAGSIRLETASRRPAFEVDLKGLSGGHSATYYIV